MEIKNIGWIGTGVMGRSMCLHLVEAGYSASVYNRTKAKAQDLLSAGATWCEKPLEVARKSDCVFTIVGYPADVEEVILGEQGVLAGAKAGSMNRLWPNESMKRQRSNPSLPWTLRCPGEMWALVRESWPSWSAGIGRFSIR
jgi:hypothetical protein